MIKKFITKYSIYNTIILFSFLLIIELLIHYFIGSSFLDWSILRIGISSLVISMVFSFICELFKKDKVSRILNIIFILLVGIIDFVELGLFNYLGFFMGIGNAEQGTKVAGYIFDFIKSLEISYYVIMLFIIMYIIYYIILDKKIINKYKITKNYNKRYKGIYLISIIVLSILYFLTVKFSLFQNDLQIIDNDTLWINPENSNLSVNNFGVNMYLISDIRNAIFGHKEEFMLNNNNNSIEDNSGAKREVDDTKWIELNNKTRDDNYKLLNNYFMSRNITSKNEMTGIFEGKNVIFILLESVNEIGILNEELFPTLYELYHNGISFTNHFSPRNNCSTGNNELTALTSLFTINNTCAANSYENNTYFHAAFNMFKNEGYYTSAYHDYSLHYYNRDVYMPKLGAEKFYWAKDLGIEYSEVYGEWPDDKYLFKNSKKYYMDKEKFFTYFVTVSPHQTYNVSSELGDKYMDKYMGLGYNDALSRYLSKIQVLDEALAELVKQLKDSGKFEDTVLVLYGDHYPYGLTDKEINEYLEANNAEYRVNRNSTSDKNVDRTPFVIYNPEVKPMEVTKYTTIIDVLPTILNMFNIDYDPRLYMGTDLFSNLHSSRAVFSDGSWQDENAFYYAPTSKITYYDNASVKYSNTTLKNINMDITERKKMSSLVLKTDYFNYLYENLYKES